LQPNLPAGLNEIILTAIAKSADERFQSADAFRNAIKSVLQSLQDAKTVVRSNAVTASAAVPAAYLKPMQSGSTVAATAATPAVSKPVTIPPVTPASSGHRGLYMALGALIVVAVLVAAGIYLPGRKKGSVAAEQGAAPAPTQPSTTPTPTAPPLATTPPPQAEVQPQTAPTPTVVPQKKVLASNQGENAAAAAAAAAEKQRQAELQKELDEVEHQIDQLTGRAGSIDSSLENLKRQQAASGYGLRGDMAEHQSSMKLNLSKAQNAIEHNDLDRAKRYAALAESDIDALEKFLGR